MKRRRDGEGHWSSVSKKWLKIVVTELQVFPWCHCSWWASVQFSSVRSLSCVQLFATPWTAARQASLSIIKSWSLFKLMSIELVMPSSHLILCCPLLPPSIFPSIGSFPMSQFFASGSQNIGASASVLPMRIQGWFPLGLTSLISLRSKELWRVFSSTTVWKHQFFDVQFL